jgi:hypothetical protein
MEIKWRFDNLSHQLVENVCHNCKAQWHTMNS